MTVFLMMAGTLPDFFLYVNHHIGCISAVIFRIIQICRYKAGTEIAPNRINRSQVNINSLKNLDL